MTKFRFFRDRTPSSEVRCGIVLVGEERHVEGPSARRAARRVWRKLLAASRTGEISRFHELGVPVHCGATWNRLAERGCPVRYTNDRWAPALVESRLVWYCRSVVARTSTPRPRVYGAFLLVAQPVTDDLDCECSRELAKYLPLFESIRLALWIANGNFERSLNARFMGALWS